VRGYIYLLLALSSNHCFFGDFRSLWNTHRVHSDCIFALAKKLCLFVIGAAAVCAGDGKGGRDGHNEVDNAKSLELQVKNKVIQVHWNGRHNESVDEVHYVLVPRYPLVPHKKTQLLGLRENAITMSNVRIPEGAKVTKKAVVAAKRQQQVDVTTHEAIAYSIIYNNLLFLGSVAVLSTFVFRGWTLIVKYALTVAASILLLLFSSKSAAKY